MGCPALAYFDANSSGTEDFSDGAVYVLKSILAFDHSDAPGNSRVAFV